MHWLTGCPYHCSTAKPFQSGFSALLPFASWAGLADPAWVALPQARAKAKFIESVDVRIALGTNPRRGDQIVRGATLLPHGTGKEPRVCVFASGADAADAAAAGSHPYIHPDTTHSQCPPLQLRLWLPLLLLVWHGAVLQQCPLSLPAVVLSLTIACGY